MIGVGLTVYCYGALGVADRILRAALVAALVGAGRELQVQP